MFSLSTHLDSKIKKKKILGNMFKQMNFFSLDMN